MNKKLISIITPMFNEEENVSYYYKNIREITDSLSNEYNFEFIITDNSSTDQTFEIIQNIAQEDKRFRIFRLSRNYGYQKSLWTGYCQSKGDACISIDCDLQDPPEIFYKFLEEWKNSYQIVYGIRESREESFLKSKQIVDIFYLRNFFYILLNKISNNDIPKNAGDFMLIDKKIVEILKGIEDHNIYIRGTIFSLGFNKKGITYKRKARKFGKTKFKFSSSLKLALDGIVSMSGLPLKIASVFGIIIAFLTTILSGYFILAKFFFDINMPAGLTTIIVLILFGISLNALFLGIIGEYIARIYDQRSNRPITIIKESIDKSED